MTRLLSNAWWMLGLHGAAAVIFGALALIWLIAAYAIAIGIPFIVLGFRVRSGMRLTAHPRRDATAAQR